MRLTFITFTLEKAVCLLGYYLGLPYRFHRRESYLGRYYQPYVHLYPHLVCGLDANGICNATLLECMDVLAE